MFMEWDEGGMFGWAWCHYQPVREINICWWYSFNIYKTLVTGFPVTKLNKNKTMNIILQGEIEEESPLSVDVEDNRYDL